MARKAKANKVKKGKKKAFIGPMPKPPANGGWAVPRGGGVQKKTESSSLARQAAPHVKAAHVKQTCAITNPFCPAAKGSKYPDGNNGGSMAFQIRGHYSFNAVSGISGAPSGGNIVVFNPHATYGILAPATFAGSTWTMSATMTQYNNVGLLTTYAQTFRIVSFGVIARCISAVTNSSGYLVMGTSAPVGVSSAILSNSSQYLDQVEVPIFAGMEHSWIAKPMGLESRVFQGMNGSSDATLNNFNAVTIEMVSGTIGATPTVIDFEYFMNLEFQLAASSGLAQLAPKDPGKNPVSTTALSGVQEKVGSFITGGVSSVESAVSKAAAQMVTDVIDGGLSFLAMF
jgi:hypothetical protein